MKRIIVSSALIVLIAVLLAVNTPAIIQQGKPDAEKTTAIVNHIYDQINANIGHPLVVAQAMAANTFLKTALADEQKNGTEQTERSITGFLSSYRDTFGYFASFVVSEKNRCYYTPDGISKIVNPKEDPYDIWYQQFVDSGRVCDLDTDRDETNGYRWTVFVNVRVEDDNGALLGVCGVGLLMDSLQEVVAQFERQYGLKINLVDDDGLVQVDSDSTNIENAYIPETVSDHAGAGAFVYTQKSNGVFRFTRCMQILEWYLVVQNFRHTKTNVFALTSVCCMFLLLLLVAVSLWREKDSKLSPLASTALSEDPLTGLPNRNYLQTAFGELGVFNTTRYKALAMFDIDRFKSVNETRDGDAIIIGMVKIAQEILSDRALLFRWGGDEFLSFLEMEADKAELLLNDFCRRVKEELDVTVSVGLVSVDLAESIKTNYHRAVQQCYAVKENGGNGVSKACL